MPSAWFSNFLKRFMCETEFPDVHDPKPKGKGNTCSDEATRKPFSCSAVPVSNLMEVIHGCKTHTDKARIGNPRSSRSSDNVLYPITHQTVFTRPKFKLLINTKCRGKGGSTFVGNLKPGGGASDPGEGEKEPVYSGRTSLNAESRHVCQKCGEKVKKFESLEAHHLSRHSVTALTEGDSSKKIVELICRTSFPASDNKSCLVERVLKVHNRQRILSLFEDYRDMVIKRANKRSKKHPRCLADGNELLRFYGTVVACSIGTKSTSALCASEKCGVCQVLRHGFSTKKESNGFPTKKESNGFRGVVTCSTSKRAYDCIELDERNLNLRKALVVCRVIAGKVHRSLESLQEMELGQSSFDSLAGKVDCNSNIEELHSNPRALLPCFVVIFKP